MYFPFSATKCFTCIVCVCALGERCVLKKLNQCNYVYYRFTNDPTGLTNFRLSGAQFWYLGNVEVYIDGQWSPVCDQSWDINDVKVLCRQLGLGEAERPRRESYFGYPLSNGTLNNFECTGNEKDLWTCQHSDAYGNACGTGNAAGAVCKHSERKI